MKTEGVSFYMDNIPQAVRNAHMEIWETLAPNVMVQHHTILSHGKSIDRVLEHTKSDVVFISDIDAIPLNDDIVFDMMQKAFANKTLIGNAQSTSHKGDYGHAFVAPSFMAINVHEWRRLGCPSFEPTSRADVGQEVTYAWQEAGLPVEMFPPLHYESAPAPVQLPDGTISNPPYWVTMGVPYGLNTTFGDGHVPVSFHGFQSSLAQHERFIAKCVEVSEGRIWSNNQHYMNAEGFFTYPELYQTAVDALWDGCIAVEVGSYKGRSALFMAEAIRNSGKKIGFYAVDHFKGSEEHADKDFFHEFARNIAPLSAYIGIIKEDSVTASKRFADGSIHFVFIDASHDYDSVVADIKAWLPKVAKGGVLAGHDWHHEPIRKAVDDTIGGALPFVGDCWFKAIG